MTNIKLDTCYEQTRNPNFPKTFKVIYNFPSYLAINLFDSSSKYFRNYKLAHIVFIRLEDQGRNEVYK